MSKSVFFYIGYLNPCVYYSMNILASFSKAEADNAHIHSEQHSKLALTSEKPRLWLDQQSHIVFIIPGSALEVWLHIFVHVVVTQHTAHFSQAHLAVQRGTQRETLFYQQSREQFLKGFTEGGSVSIAVFAHVFKKGRNSEANK